MEETRATPCACPASLEYVMDANVNIKKSREALSSSVFKCQMLMGPNEIILLRAISLLDTGTLFTLTAVDSHK